MSGLFDFATAGRIAFGAGRLMELGAIAREFGSRVLFVTGAGSERAKPVRQLLDDAGFDVVTEMVNGEPTISRVEVIAGIARDSRRELVIAFGGGSVIDGAKAAAALATNSEPALRYLEVVGQGQPLIHDPLPMIAVPTTAGTGAEVTRNAVLHSVDHQVKVSLRSARMLPRVALVDPETTLSLPASTTATTGMDALTQLIEPFLSCRANPLTDALCREAIPRVVRSLERAVHDGGDLSARTDMAFASLCSGMSLANAGLGAVHGLAAPLGGMYAAPHGAICAALLLPVLRTNLKIAVGSAGHRATVERFAELAGLLTNGESRSPGFVLDRVSDLVQKIGVSGLSRYGIKSDDFPKIAERALAASSMKGNPVSLTVKALEELLTEAL